MIGRRLPNRGTKRWSIRHHGTKRKLRRPRGIYWNYNGDGVFWHERVPTYERHRLRKWLNRLTLKQEMSDAERELEQER